jgi:hypothetical protein
LLARASKACGGMCVLTAIERVRPDVELEPAGSDKLAEHFIDHPSRTKESVIISNPRPEE